MDDKWSKKKLSIYCATLERFMKLKKSKSMIFLFYIRLDTLNKFKNI